VYPFNEATQGSNLMGTFSSWIVGNDPTCPSGQRYLSQYFNNGATCGSTPRTANVTFTCGGSMVVTAATEPATCQYQLTLDVNCSANPAKAGTMCVYPSNSPTPSITPSGTGSSSRTPSQTPSASVTPTPSQSSGSLPIPSGSETPRCVVRTARERVRGNAPDNVCPPRGLSLSSGLSHAAAMHQSPH
jgi:hypothetical protein